MEIRVPRERSKPIQKNIPVPQVDNRGVCPGCDGAKIVDNQTCTDCQGTGKVEIFNHTGNKTPWKNQ